MRSKLKYSVKVQEKIFIHSGSMVLILVTWHFAVLDFIDIMHIEFSRFALLVCTEKWISDSKSYKFGFF